MNYILRCAKQGIFLKSAMLQVFMQNKYLVVTATCHMVSHQMYSFNVSNIEVCEVYLCLSFNYLVGI